MKKLILKSFQSPGDIVMLTATVRDLHAEYPGEIQTDVRTSAEEIWENNPLITPLEENDPNVRTIQMHYPLIHQSNQRPYHFIHGYAKFLEETIGLPIPIRKFHGDIHLSQQEKQGPPDLGLKLPKKYWIVISGGKYDFTAKWWNPENFQEVIDHFYGRLEFVQCGEEGHWHPPLADAVNLVGKTSTRELIQLIHHAEGVLCPVTLAMHLAAAVPAKEGFPRLRPCVVLAGGREPAHWEAYPGHQFISTIGALNCCATGGCWKSRCQLVGDGDAKDRSGLCEQPVQVTPDLRIPRCMEMITPDEVIRRIEFYLPDLFYCPHQNTAPRRKNMNQVQAQEVTPAVTDNGKAVPVKTQVLIKFRHGLGDAVQLTSVLRHLNHYHGDWEIDVAALVGTHSAFTGLCRKVYLLDKDEITESDYDRVLDLSWDECPTCYENWPSSKVERCLLENFQLAPIAEFGDYSIQQSQQAVDLARRYLQQHCRVTMGEDGRYPVVLIHYEGNTSADKKNLPVHLIRKLCQDILDCGFTPVILDWDQRTPLADGERIFNPHANLELWGGTGTGDAEALAALIELSTLMVGVDSGPLHAAAATSTPTLGVWTSHHPLHYCCAAENVTHLVPKNHTELLRGDRDKGEAYFETHYRYLAYQDLADGLRAAVTARLQDGGKSLVYMRNHWIRTDNAEQDLVVVADIAEQDSYRIDAFPMQGPVVVDIGAHIGCFSKRLLQRQPLARVIAVECCPENILALKKNLGTSATILSGAATYEKEVALLNAVFPDCETTGGSTVIDREKLQQRVDSGELRTEQDSQAKQYWADFRKIETFTLEEILAQQGLDHIDILKLDCEGSEFSILGKTTLLNRIGLIVGEYHGKDRFLKLVEERFGDWELTILKGGELGLFWLKNPNWPVQNKPAIQTTRTGCGDKEAFWDKFTQAVHEIDRPSLELWKPGYIKLYELMQELRPERICEIGVRAGYSAFTMLSALPEARVLGIDADLDESLEDTHGGRKDLWRHAQKILRPFDFQLLLANSQNLLRLPQSDLIYVDGDHTFEGCLSDLQLASASTDCILTDDYELILEVRAACHQFMKEHPEFTSRQIDNGLSGLLLLERK